MYVLWLFEVCMGDEVLITGCDCVIIDINLFINLISRLLKIQAFFVVGVSKASPVKHTERAVLKHLLHHDCTVQVLTLYKLALALELCHGPD